MNIKNEALISARKVRKWTQNKAAKRAKIERSTLASLETKGNLPNLKTAYKIADAYGLSVYDIFLPEYVENIDKGE